MLSSRVTSKIASPMYIYCLSFLQTIHLICETHLLSIFFFFANQYTWYEKKNNYFSLYIWCHLLQIKHWICETHMRKIVVLYLAWRLKSKKTKKKNRYLFRLFYMILEPRQSRAGSQNPFDKVLVTPTKGGVILEV
jgi:midasin (ATPase involved in ribosome maturation)